MTNHKLLSAFYHPTTIVAIDDNQNFLKTIKLLFAGTKVELFEDPLTALAFLNQYSQPTLSAKKVLTADAPELYAIENYQFNLNLINFLSVLNNAARFNEIAVVIVDYHMAGMNGLELCGKLKDHGYKIILITADEDRSIAVDELSKGTIDYYLMKNEPEFNNKLNAIVEKMKMAYFYELSKSIIEPLARDMSSIFNQIAFADFINHFITENNITEYYLIDPNGSFVMIDIDSNIHWLIIKSDEDLNAYLDLATDSQAPLGILNAIKARTILPFFATKSEITQVEGKLWENHTYPARPIKNIENFYYGHITDKVLFPLK